MVHTEATFTLRPKKAQACVVMSTPVTRQELLAAFMLPANGQILVNGEPIEAIELRWFEVGKDQKPFGSEFLSPEPITPVIGANGVEMPESRATRDAASRAAPEPTNGAIQTRQVPPPSDVAASPKKRGRPRKHPVKPKGEDRSKIFTCTLCKEKDGSCRKIVGPGPAKGHKEWHASRGERVTF